MQTEVFTREDKVSSIGATQRACATEMLMRGFRSLLQQDLVRPGLAATAAAGAPFKQALFTRGELRITRAAARTGESEIEIENEALPDEAHVLDDDAVQYAEEAAPVYAQQPTGDRYFQAYLTAVRNRERLNFEDEQKQFVLMSHPSADVCAAARNTLLQANLWVVPIVVRRFYRYGGGFEDLVAEGNLGLYQALQRFDPTRGLRFSTYAKWWVVHAVTTAMAASAYPVRVPRRIALQLTRQRRSSELPELEAVEAGHKAADIAMPLGESYEAEADLRVGETSDHQPETLLALRQGLQLLGRALEELTPRQRLVMEGRYGLNGSSERTLQDLADELGLSAEGVRKIQMAATEVLKQKLAKGWL